MASDIIKSPQSTGSNGGDMIVYKYCRPRDGFVHLDVIVDGKRIRRSTGRPATPANLKYVDKNWQSEVDRITSKSKVEIVDNGEITVKRYGLKSLSANRSRRKDSTNSDYMRVFELHIVPIFGEIPLSQVLQSDIKMWQTHLKEEKKLCGARIHVISIVFQGIMSDALTDRLIEINPFNNLKGLPRTALKEISPLTFEEVRYILSNADGWFKNFMTLAFFTGMRTGEMLALRWEDVNLHSGKIIVRSSMTRGKIGTTKTGKVREIDVLDPVMQALREQFKETGLRGGFVFYSNKTQNAFTNSSSIAKINWKPLLKRLLIGERTLYQTRHTFATMMISKGEDIMWVSNMLGHADSSITLSIYARYRENKTVKRASFLDKVEVFNAVRETRTCHVSVTQENLELEIKLA